MALQTTTLGAYPKPDYLKVPDWWTDSRRGKYYTFDYVPEYEEAIRRWSLLAIVNNSCDNDAIMIAW